MKNTAAWIFGAGLLFCIGVGYGCGSNKPAESSTATFTTASEQIAYGATVYKQRCSSCHGDSGQGSAKAPPLVGPTALPKQPRDTAMARTTEFRTAMDVAGFATHNMPPSEAKRKEMTERDYWAVLAFALSANGVKLAEPVGPKNAGGIVLHP